MEQTRKRNKAMLAAGLLLVLVLVTTSIVCGMLARFVVTDSGKDLSRVAKFEVTGSGFTETINIGVTMNPGDTKNFSEGEAFVIRNKSEVSVKYTVTLKNTTQNLPLELKVNGADQTAAFRSNDGYRYEVTLAPNSANQSFAFSLVWPTTTPSGVTPLYTDPAYSLQLDNISVTVTAEQVD